MFLSRAVRVLLCVWILLSLKLSVALQSVIIREKGRQIEQLMFYTTHPPPLSADITE